MSTKSNISDLLQEIVQNPKFIVKDVCDMDVEPGKIGKLRLLCCPIMCLYVLSYLNTVTVTAGTFEP